MTKHHPEGVVTVVTCRELIRGNWKCVAWNLSKPQWGTWRPACRRLSRVAGQRCETRGICSKKETGKPWMGLYWYYCRGNLTYLLKMDEHGPCIIMYSWFSYYQRWCSIVLSVYQMGHDIQYTFIHWEINPLRLDDKYGLSFRLEVFFILFQMLGTQLDWCFSSRIPRSDDQALFGAQFMALVEGKNYRKPLWLVITHVDFSFTIPLYYTSIASHSSSGCFHSPWTLREGDGERERESSSTI